MALLCLSVTGRTLEDCRRKVEETAVPVDLIELRADFLDTSELPFLPRFPGMVKTPVILTIRKPEDGGKFGGTEQDRASLLKEAALESRPAYSFLDLELGTDMAEVEASCSARGLTVIRSFHDFSGVPADLPGLLRQAGEKPGEIPKAAVTPKSTGDIFTVLAAARENRRAAVTAAEPGVEPRQIIIGMGPWGVPVRLLAAKFGSWLGYSSSASEPAAPGHMTPETMQKTYRFGTVSEGTKVYGIIGDPVLHSRSPLIHNPAFAYYNRDAVYVPFPTDDPGLFLGKAGELGAEGISVTVPHKERILSAVDALSPEAEAAGSCNTALRSGGGWTGYNTDAPGFWAPLERIIGETGKAPRTATVVGAGGAARAVVYALVKHGIDVCVVNRSPARAGELAGRYGVPWAGLDAEGLSLAASHADLIVQTTSAGMTPLEEADPWPELRLTGKEIVYEVVYAPKVTPFVRRASEAGCLVVYGEAMLREQGYRQFSLFTGLEYPAHLKTIE
jgi:3-dehydroquinate dehydratase/shikimate dehydrogenase